jgi:hypothetical protein
MAMVSGRLLFEPFWFSGSGYTAGGGKQHGGGRLATGLGQGSHNVFAKDMPALWNGEPSCCDVMLWMRE